MSALRRHLSDLHNDNLGVLCCEDLYAHILLNVLNCTTYAVGYGCGSPFGLMNAKILSNIPVGSDKSQSIAHGSESTRRYYEFRNSCPVVDEIGFKAFCEHEEWQLLIGCRLGFKYSLSVSPLEVQYCRY